MNSRYHSDENAPQYRTVARKTDGSYDIIATWSTFEKALGCCFGFFTAEKLFYESKMKEKSMSGGANENVGYSTKYLTIFVQRCDPKVGYCDWTTLTQTSLQFDFDCFVKVSPNDRKYKSGDFCEAVLLARKTNKGGWIAKIANTNYEGPITNTSDVPTSMLPGKIMKLKIGAIGKTGDSIQFTWVGAR